MLWTSTKDSSPCRSRKLAKSRHFLTTIGKTKSKKVSDVGILRNLMEMLAELEAKQGRIYTKFSKLHQLVSKASGNDQLESEIASLNSVVVQLSNNLESRGLSRIVEECKTLVRIFKEISSHKEGIDVDTNHHRTWSGYNSWATECLNLRLGLVTCSLEDSSS